VSLNLAQILAESAVRHADRPAVILGDLRISYAQLWRQARQYARVLEQNGVQAGDRVALLLPNTPHFPLAYFGALSLGAVAVPVHALLKAEEIAYVLHDSGAKLLICATPLLAAGGAGAEKVGVPVLTVMPGGDGGDNAPERIDELAASAEPIAAITPREPSDPAVILYTSGTTGTPKGAVLTHLNVLMNVDVSVIDSFNIAPDDIVLGCLPLFHTFGQTCCMNTAFRAGAAIVLMPRFDGAAALELLERERCTVFMGVPTMYFALLEAARARPEPPNISLHSAMSGGSALPLPMLERFKEVFGVDVMEGYGLTETSPVATFNQKNFEPRPGTVGPPIWGVEVEITRAELDDRIDLLPAGELGEVIVRGHNVFAGYLNNPEATAATFTDGWFRTGDLGTKDADGYLTIVDRKKEMILRGGFNVYPREVEELLVRHPGVGQVAVIGAPDEKYGEEICAVVVRDSSAPPVTAEELSDWAKQRIAGYKYPRIVYFVEAMPMGPSGKILKRQLVADFRDRS
jgi:long-chain acyl-CoA synthetase